ncbi:MAG: transporter substrate-binding domain-containing protein [Rhodoferax sp.]|nr:transporter substrate-binding domain-containing protein [Rhodoferax sp.]
MLTTPLRTEISMRVLVSSASKFLRVWCRAWTAVLLGSLGFVSGVQAGDKLVLTTGVLAPYTTPDRKGFLDQIIPAIFREAGLDAELQVFPTSTARTLLNANAGVDDGEAMRIAGLEKQYPNLIRVPETLIVNDFVAYATHLQLATPNWQSIEPYVLSYIIGWKIFEKNVTNAREVTPVRDADQLFGLLANGRADLALYERWQGLARVQALGLKAHALEPPLARTDMFMYLHKKHEALVPRVAQALVRLKANGTYQRIFDATLTSKAP